MKRNKRTHEEWLNELSHSHDGNYDSCDKYVNSKTKLKVIHLTCGTSWMTTPPNFLDTEIPCPTCRKLSSLSQKKSDLNKYVIKKTHGEYRIIGDYKGAHKNIELVHHRCNNAFERTPDKIKSRKIICPSCFGSVLERYGSWEEYVFSQVGDEYTFLEEYTDATSKISVIHNGCGYKYKVSPNKFQENRRCPRCFGKIKKTSNQFEEDMKKVHGKNYTLIGEYKNARIKVEMLHNKCGNIWSVSPDSILRGTGCPACSVSKGEELISDVLKMNNVNFTSQYSFKDLKNINSLYFDFAIIDEDDKVLMLIEYDGEQHFKPIEHFGGKKKFKKTVFRDELKNSYCDKNGIKLLRIPYWEFDRVEEILIEEVKEYV